MPISTVSNIVYILEATVVPKVYIKGRMCFLIPLELSLINFLTDQILISVMMGMILNLGLNFLLIS